MTDTQARKKTISQTKYDLLKERALAESHENTYFATHREAILKAVSEGIINETEPDRDLLKLLKKRNSEAYKVPDMLAEFSQQQPGKNDAKQRLKNMWCKTLSLCTTIMPLIAQYSDSGPMPLPPMLTWARSPMTLHLCYKRGDKAPKPSTTCVLPVSGLKSTAQINRARVVVTHRNVSSQFLNYLSGVTVRLNDGDKCMLPTPEDACTVYFEMMGEGESQIYQNLMYSSNEDNEKVKRITTIEPGFYTAKSVEYLPNVWVWEIESMKPPKDNEIWVPVRDLDKFLELLEEEIEDKDEKKTKWIEEKIDVFDLKCDFHPLSHDPGAFVYSDRGDGKPEEDEQPEGDEQPDWYVGKIKNTDWSRATKCRTESRNAQINKEKGDDGEFIEERNYKVHVRIAKTCDKKFKDDFSKKTAGAYSFSHAAVKLLNAFMEIAAKESSSLPRKTLVQLWAEFPKSARELWKNNNDFLSIKDGVKIGDKEEYEVLVPTGWEKKFKQSSISKLRELYEEKYGDNSNDTSKTNGPSKTKSPRKPRTSTAKQGGCGANSDKKCNLIISPKGTYLLHTNMTNATGRQIEFLVDPQTKFRGSTRRTWDHTTKNYTNRGVKAKDGEGNDILGADGKPTYSKEYYEKGEPNSKLKFVLKKSVMLNEVLLRGWKCVRTYHVYGTRTLDGNTPSKGWHFPLYISEDDAKKDGGEAVTKVEIEYLKNRQPIKETFFRTGMIYTENYEDEDTERIPNQYYYSSGGQAATDKESGGQVLSNEEIESVYQQQQMLKFINKSIGLE